MILGAGRTFVAGADINDLQQAAWGEGAGPPNIHDFLQQIEDCSKPIVMAIHGTALGGGVELAMAGHYRVAVADARLGQPEVNLGIVPGAEGTQRLPRLVGVEKAIDMCVSGKPIAAADALRAGLIDRVLDGDLRAGARWRSPARSRAGPVAIRGHAIVSDKLGTPESNAPLFAAGRELARKNAAQSDWRRCAVVDAIEAATRLPFEDGCAREREILMECLRSDQCKALIHAFFAERAVAKVPDIPRDARAAAVESVVAIIGAGTMGGGIAMACANAGLRVVLIGFAEPRRSIAAWRRFAATTNRRSSAAACPRRTSSSGWAGSSRNSDYERLRRGRPDHRSRVREPGAQESRCSRARRRRQGRMCAGDQHVDARHRRDRRRDRASRIRSSACTSSVRRT